MRRLALLSLFAAFAAAPADAAVSVFTDLTAWQAAAGFTVLEDFSTSPAGPLAPGSTDIGAFSIFLDKNTPDPGGAVRNRIDAERFVGYLDDPTQSIDVGALSIRFDFETPITAFAGDWTSTTNGDRVTVLIDGSLIQFDNFLADPGTGFLGFVSTSPFSAMLFGLEIATTAIDGEAFALDNARLTGVPPAEVPEPGALILLATALAGLGIPRGMKGGARA